MCRANSTSDKATQALIMPNQALQIDALLKRVQEMEEEMKVMEDEGSRSEAIIKKLKADLKKSIHRSSDIQRVCTQMAKVHADSSNKKSKGLAGVLEMADPETRHSLQVHAQFVVEKVWANKKLMPNNWQEFSTEMGTPCHSSLYNIRKLMPDGWTHEALWVVFLVAVTVEVLKTQRSQKTLALHTEFKSK